MKLNWGFGIFVLYTSFVIFILFLVYKSTQQKVDLVTEDYYQQELEYQNVINKKDNANKLDSGLTYSIDKMSVILNFPPQQKDIKGEVKIYRPSNDNFDKLFEIELNTENQMKVLVENSPLGLYKLMVTWDNDSIGYYVEKDVYLKP